MMSEKTGYINGKQTETYRIWAGMKNRCRNESNKDFARYGGRGIKVCVRWLTYANFLFDMGARPAGMTIDRKENSGDYEHDNCRWATRKTQRRNNSENNLVTLAGNVITVAEACELVGKKHNNVRQRLLRGWTVERALTQPERATKRG